MIVFPADEYYPQKCLWGEPGYDTKLQVEDGLHCLSDFCGSTIIGVLVIFWVSN